MTNETSFLTFWRHLNNSRIVNRDPQADVFEAWDLYRQWCAPLRRPISETRAMREALISAIWNDGPACTTLEEASKALRNC